MPLLYYYNRFIHWHRNGLSLSRKFGYSYFKGFKEARNATLNLELCIQQLEKTLDKRASTFAVYFSGAWVGAAWNKHRFEQGY